MATFETSLKSRLIYVFAIPDEWHKDCLKVGETTLEEDDGNFLCQIVKFLTKLHVTVLTNIRRRQVLLTTYSIRK